MPDAGFDDLAAFLSVPETDCPIEIARKPSCLHRNTRLEAVSRRVYCRDCDSEVEAFEILRRIVADRLRWEDDRRATVEKAMRVRGRLEELLRLERNARSRLRRLGVEAPAKPWGD